MTSAFQPNRLPLGGRILRDQPLAMRFDKRDVAAFQGDTLASALLANGVSIVGRGFKYHRPRGIFSAGPEEPGALVQLGENGRATPNTPATMIPAADGLRAQSQNCFPSLQYDLGAANQLLAPFIAAGFYYKTFIGPGQGTKFWMFCEKFIRQAAGLGKAPDSPDPDSYDKVNAFCDILVVGGGVAGLSAALSAARAGARVTLAEQHPDFGGALRGTPPNGETDQLVKDLLAELKSLPNAKLLPQTVVFGAYDSGVFGLIENADHSRRQNASAPRLRFHLLRAKSAVLAAGAVERPPMFGANDLPGVMLCESARIYANHFAVLPGKNAVVFANNDRAYATAADLAACGAQVHIVDPRKNPPPAAAAFADAAGVSVRAGHAVLRAQGFGKVRAVQVGKIESGLVGGALETIPCDLLAVSSGWSPAVHLWSQRGGAPVFDEKRFAFFADDSCAGNLIPAGLCAGVCGLRECAESGFAAGKKAASMADIKGRAGQFPDIPESPADSLEGFAPPLFAADNWGEPRGKVFVDLQNDATVSDVRQAAEEGYEAPEHLKRYTTIGMGTEQGKTANDNALFILAGATGKNFGGLSPPTYRPPYAGAAIGALAGAAVGRRFRPFRFSPMHAAHLECGARMTEAGLWLRPHYYPRGGETLEAASLREAAHVREKAGVVDVSTLGKIAVQGPDAAEFLNRVYANRWDSLATGKARYGAMLREDGMVFDDGVTARLGEDDFFMTTTTANAGPVLSHLEKLLQTRWPELRAQVASVSDEWGAVAVAGPRSREWLSQAAGKSADLSDAALPHMGFVWGEIGGARVRILRVSFSGERAYEVYARADCGSALWLALTEAGRAVEGIPYGVEALGILRIEKGHPAGPELDGRTTLRDLRLDRMAKKAGGFIGAALRKRAFLEEESRPVLVGLRAENPHEEIRAGSLLHSGGALKGNGEGWVSSAARSPAVGGFIALGFLTNGLSREGESVLCANPMEGGTVRARVEAPCFVDPEGGRMAG